MSAASGRGAFHPLSQLTAVRFGLGRLPTGKSLTFPAVTPGQAWLSDPKGGQMLPVEGFLAEPLRYGEWAHAKQPASSPCRALGMGVAGTPLAEKKVGCRALYEREGRILFPMRKY